MEGDSKQNTERRLFSLGLFDELMRRYEFPTRSRTWSISLHTKCNIGSRSNMDMLLQPSELSERLSYPTVRRPGPRHAVEFQLQL